MTAVHTSTAPDPGSADAVPGQVEVRLLQGPVRARRADGRLVDARALRTRKTADLLTILALSAGQPVGVPRLLAALWPDVEEERGRASLRTAASEVRRALGGDHVHRDKAGLVLTGVWTDVQAFLSLAAAAAGSRGTDTVRALRAAWEAEHLHLAELSPYAVDADWVVEARARLLVARRTLLAEGAEAGLELGRLRDTVCLATRLVEVDPYDERGYRALMLAHAGLGELEPVVTTWSVCRRVLTEELGLDPTPQTRAAHAEALRVAAADEVRDEPCDRTWPPGRVLDDDDLRELVGQVLSAEPSPDLVRQVAAETDRRVDSVGAVVSAWVRERRLVASHCGLVLVPAGVDVGLDGMREVMASLHARLSAAELEALEVVALAPGLVTAGGLARALDHPLHVATGLLGRLEELELVSAEQQGHRPRDPLLARVLVASLRPGALAAVQRRARESASALPGRRQPAGQTGDDGLVALLQVVAPLVAARDLRGVDAAVARATASGTAAQDVDPVAAVLVGSEALVLLGAARRLAGRAAAPTGPGQEVSGPVVASGVPACSLPLLVRHDLGARVGLPDVSSTSGHGRWLPLRIAVERGDLDLARQVTRRPVPAAGPLERVLHGLAEGRLLAALGDDPAAARKLQAALDLAVRRDVRLLLPEVAARLALVTAPTDPATATALLDRAEEALGEAVFGRERVAMLLARASLRAGAGRHEEACSSAGVAADVAARLGLVWLEAEARAAVAFFRRGARRSPGAAQGGPSAA